MPAPDAVIQTVDDALRLVTARGRTDLEARLRKTRERLADDRVRVLVIGEFKQGKSQLVNALVRARVCPVDDDIATSVPTAVYYAEKPTVTLVKEAPGADPDDEAAAIRVERTEATLEDLARYVSEMGNPANREGLSHVEVGLPTPLLESGLELVDTPGVGGLGSVRATATLAALPGADAVLLVSDAAQEYTAAELEFLKHAIKLCPNVACVLTKIDLYPEWRRIYELNQAHLQKAGVTAQLIPVSSVLRWHALDRNDNDLNVESGFPVLATMLSNTVGQAELLVRRAVANTVSSVTEQLARGLQSELGVQEHPETVQSTVADLRIAKERMTALRERGARWQQTLADGVADLAADIDYDLRDRMRDIMRNAEDEIEVLGDPAVVWVEFAPWVEEQVAGATNANFVWANERARFLAAQVAEHFAEDGQLSLPDLDVGAGSSMQAVRPMYLGGDEEDPTLGAQALIAVRGGYIGTLMFGMFSTFAGLALLNPFSVGAGLLLGGRTLREEKKRLLARRQAEAKNAVRRYSDDVIFHIGKDSRDMLRRVQRQLRDHFTEVATELETSLQESLRTAEAGARTNAADREARINELRRELAAVTALAQQARALVSVPAQAAAQ
ncbi:MAG TPA: dynamin family protein [Sporichthya sp.]|nr:dynamin family protein [Sporichthya sp.]